MSLTQFRNLLLEYRLPLVCVILVLILVPIVFFQLAVINTKNTPINIQVARPMDVPNKTQNLKIGYSGANLNLPKKISAYHQELTTAKLDQISHYAKLLSIEGEPKQFSPGSNAFIWKNSTALLTFSPTIQKLEIKKFNVKSGQNNDNGLAEQQINNLLVKLGININTTLDKTPKIENFKEMILNPEKGKAENADFLQLTYTQSIDGLPVISQNPDNYSIRGRFVFGEIQNLELDLGIQNAPIKGKEHKTVNFQKIVKTLEAGGGTFISALNPEENTDYATQAKTAVSIDLNNAQVAYYQNLSEKIDLIPVLIFSGTLKFTDQKTRNVRIIAPLLSSYVFTQP